jgi:hypothetical protein
VNEGTGQESKGEELQFDKAEFTAPDAMRVCSRCQARLEQEYFEADGHFVCSACAREVGSDEGWGNFRRALAFGAGAALIGTIVWFSIIKLTDREFGLIAIAVGLLVGFAVRHGARGRGGWRYQALAMVLTYVSITASYVPLVIKSIREADDTDQQEQAAAPEQAKQPKQGSGPAPAAASDPATGPEEAQASAGGVALALLVVFALAFASPFLGGFSNIMGLLIIGIALYEAWKLNKRVVVNGPFQIRAGPAAETA